MDERLSAYLTTALARPFDWATHNCCHFAAGWVRTVEGVDALAGMPPLTGAGSARRLLRWLGGLPAAVTLRLGREPVPGAQARVGDVVALPLAALGGQPGHYTVGICAGVSAALGVSVSVFVTDTAAIYWPTAEASHAWHVQSATEGATA